MGERCSGLAQGQRRERVSTFAEPALVIYVLLWVVAHVLAPAEEPAVGIRTSLQVQVG
jgi:hypothetical protein